MIDHIRIVLVETSHPGNIGASARAMKTMGFARLYLVQPKLFPHADATARAAGADDILANAKVYETLTEAIKDCTVVYATSARLRTLSSSVLTPQYATKEIINNANTQSPVAIVFGRENSGLTNEELDSCNKMIMIPTNENFSSLNLASAVQIICYELFREDFNNHHMDIELKSSSEKITNEELGNFYNYLQECLIGIKFLDPHKPRKLMRRLKQLFNRAELDQNEYNILMGILAAVNDKSRKK
jgi:tRNA (cytidine32/uridine32-2'-O)-methyltransferase